jgi:hypothetical protein
MTRIWRAIANHGWAHPVLGLTVVALDGIVDSHSRVRLTVDPSIDRLLPDEDEGRAF